MPGPTNPLSGAYITPPLTVSHMARVAHQAGYETADIDEYLAGLRAVQQVTYTLRLTDDLWVVFESRDGAAGEEVWSGALPGSRRVGRASRRQTVRADHL